MRRSVVSLCALMCGCTLLFEPGVDSDAGPELDSEDANSDGSAMAVDAGNPNGSMIGPCTLGTGAPSTLALTVQVDSTKVQVCGPNQTTCGDGVMPPCSCDPGTQCSIPFPIESRVFMETETCSKWTGPTGIFATKVFDVTIDDDPGPLVIVESFTSCL